jgi:ABC-type polysaccharide/polyol phosphate export permease
MSSISGTRNGIIGNLYGFMGAYREQFAVSRRTTSYLNFFVAGVPAVAVLAWVATRSQTPLAFALISVGACLMVMWTTAVFYIGWSASNEIADGIFHANLLSKTPVSVIMLGKAISYVSYTALTGLGAFLVFLAIAHKLPSVGNLPAFIVSLLVSMFAMVCASFIFAPLAVLVDARGGVFGAIMPFGVVFSGFLYRVSVMPTGFKVIARLLPTSYSMDGVIRSIEGNVSVWRIAGDWGIALAISLVYLAASYFLFRIVDKRVRKTGILSTF